MKSLLALLALFSSPVHADLIVGAGANAVHGLSHVGYQMAFDDLTFALGGGWISGFNNSLWLSPSVGMRAHSSLGLDLHVSAGPAYIHNPEPVHRGHFRASMEGGIGIQDERTYIGLAYKHIDAFPDGSDFIVIQLRITDI